MPAPPRDVLVRAGGEVRGTQSFVQVMAAVFRRPSLMLMEVAWRWMIGVVVVAIVAATNREAWTHRFDPSYWRSFGEAMLHGAFSVQPTVAGLLLVFLLVLLWAAVSGAGRSAVLSRIDPALRPRRGTVMALSVVRSLAFAVLMTAWVWALLSIWLRLTASQDPNYVAGFAGAVVFTLLLFMFWSVVSWVFPLAITIAMVLDLGTVASFRAALKSGKLRGKLIEINLVMGIVKIALVVLAMVFSATPLPFQSYTTDTFMLTWWIGVVLFYVVASDFFHVVRAAAYLALSRAYEFPSISARATD